MKKKAMGVLVLALLTALASAPARGELCPKCKGKMYIMNIGKCVECGGMTTSGAFKLCKKCSTKLGECEHCRAKLKGGARPVKPVPRKPDIKPLATRRHGKWEHELLIANASSLSRVTVGILKFNGEVVAGKTHGNSMWTPWGRLIFFQRRYLRGWMPLLYAGHPLPKGAELASPDPKTGAQVKQRYEQLKKSLGRFTLDLRYLGDQDKPFYNLTLRGPALLLDEKRPPFSPAVQITREQAAKIIEHLASDGYLARAGNQANKDLKAPAGPTYGLFVRGPDGLELYEYLGWDLNMLRRLEALRTVLEGDAAKKMALLLGRLSGYKKIWEAKK